MNIWEIDKLILFIAFIIPGFVCLKVYDTYVPGEKLGMSNMLIDVLAYSCINYALLSWLIIYLVAEKSIFSNSIKASLFLIFVLVIFPFLLATSFYLLRKTRRLSKYFNSPVSKPWDFVFGQKESYWVIVHMNDGSKIGGKYDTLSFTSSFPRDEQIYLQEVWKLDEDNKFLHPVERSKGVIIFGENIKSVELFR